MVAHYTIKEEKEMNVNILLRLIWCITVAILLVMAQSPASAEVSGKIIIFNAGSLTIPLAKMEKEFEAKYPGVNVLREAAGSRKCARKITDLKKPCDIMASADYTVIDQLLIPAYANWNIRFAGCIFYAKSKI